MSQGFDNLFEEYTGNDKNVVISEEYSGIDGGAFAAGRDIIVSIQIDALFETIEYGTFQSCKKLENINIPYTVKEIGHYAFSGCKKLKELKLPPTLNTIGDSAFRSCSAIREVAIPISTKSIGSSAFKFCKQLETAYIPKTVKKIGKDAFSNCPELTIVTSNGSFAEKFANKENISVRLITDAELTAKIKDVNTNGEEIDSMVLQLKMAQQQGYATIVQDGDRRVLMKNQTVYTETEYYNPYAMPEFMLQGEEFCYISGRENIEQTVANLRNEGMDIAHGYIVYDERKLQYMTDDEAKKVFQKFETICNACKNPEFLSYLYHLLPVKKNGSLHIGRKPTLAMLPMFYHEKRKYAPKSMESDYSYNLVAKIESETEVSIRVERTYLMDQPHEDNYRFSVTTPIASAEEIYSTALRVDSKEVQA